MSTDWDEIKRLAADFQKVQLSSTLQRLSERNCIEVVSLLLEKGLLEIIYTNDGKEYLTPDQLSTEIQDELYVNGGRVNLTEVSNTLNVDLNKITGIANKITQRNKSVHLILGQLINEDYIQRLALEINEKLIQSGEISAAALAEQYDLPSDFILQKIIEPNVGKTILGKRDSSDPKVFFTQTYISRCKAKIRGALSALSRPTPISSILGQCKIKEKIFYSLVDEISFDGSVTSKMSGAQYIPNVYKKAQNEWVTSLFKQNGYVQHDTLSHFGISDIKVFIQRQLPNENLVHLKKCTVGKRFVEQLEAAIEECVSSGSYLDVTTILPTDLTQEDIDKLLETAIKPTTSRSILVLDTTIFTNAFLDRLVAPVKQIIEDNVKKAVESGIYQQYLVEKLSSSRQIGYQEGTGDAKADRREERRRKAAVGKGGGGTQGRETKTKSTKKHYRGGGGDKGGFNSDSDDNNHNNRTSKKKSTNMDLITLKEIIQVVESSLNCEELCYLAKDIALHFYPQYSKEALQKANQVYEASLQNSTQNRRQTHASLQEKLNNLLTDVRLYEKGLKLFPSDDQQQLIKYLLKTLGTEICNELFFYVAMECSLNFSSSSLMPDQRSSIIQECGQEYKSALASLNKSLGGQSVDDFLMVSENALQECSMILKKVDKKKDRSVILAHKYGLLEQLGNCSDPALVLHLTCLVIFTISTQCMLHASGRHVATILTFLQPQLQTEQAQLLMKYHDLVLKVLTAPEGDVEAKSEMLCQLEDLTPAVKDLASSFKKTTLSTNE
ncbi:E3 UFM1-protein ligase 1 homolog [Phlebotomus argentipes]|uniref:E3 UFM1-protein ligase 1 homolog n=1 Tax=Phlebotomus argentipes TaxID=94469 RepID=UPI0028933BAE|nr:E3 UFM1-protein ligase 1 homolog [Phlebotomus argentipes]XP_059619733.1 E3 UFM1-protein ligase 1 homolog [Phlebotomus argentipes]XP_059619734.1 E3 UFM1-protein ligase 1 homolog [Phlebotomus argentipes]